MTNTDIYFDTDCLCAFLWVNGESLVIKLYGQIILPKHVYNEISRVPHLVERVNKLINKNQVILMDLSLESDEHKIFLELSETIGDGEASAISLAKQYNGIVASNNLKDVSIYVKKFNLRHVTTGDIMVQAYIRGFISEDDGNVLWKKMLDKRRKLGANSFSEYLKVN